jgi:hypothetical protein
LEHAQSRRGADGRPLRIVHHDVTPSNIMVRRDGHVKLVDFGVARSVLMSRMSAGALRGKLPYLSPEHARQQRVDRRTDLFSLGLVAMELLSGQRALDVAEPEALEEAYSRLPARIQALTGQGLCGPETQHLIGQMVEIQADARPASAGEVADRAEALLVAHGEGSPARTLTTELTPAFVILEARARSFDQTLSQIVGVSEAANGLDATGTLSLPGIEVVQVAQASARDETASGPDPSRQKIRGRKRLFTAAMALLVAAVAGGFWLGARRGGVPAVARTPTRSVIVLPAPADAGATGDIAVTASADTAAPATATDAGSGDRGAAHFAGQPTPTEADPVRPESSRQGSAQVHKRIAEVPTGMVEFRVLPADCKVAVDGRPQRPVDTNRYRLRLTPGDHQVRIEDRETGKWKVIEVNGLLEGEARKLTGTSLGEGLP